MRYDRHPYHYTPIVDGDALEIPSDIALLEVWTSDIPMVRVDNARAFFTNRWMAAKFLSPHVSDEATFHTKEHQPRSVVDLALDVGNQSLTIDPCVLCGWNEVIVVSPSRIETAVDQVVAQIVIVRERVRRMKDLAGRLMASSEFEDAYEILRNLVGHLNPGEAEVHYLIGLCALSLNDQSAYDQALANLATVDETWEQKLLARGGPPGRD